MPPFRGDPDAVLALIESLVAEEFDITTCQEMRVDHGSPVPMSLLWPGAGLGRCATVPIAINTVQHPLPTPARCYKFGQAIGPCDRLVPDDAKVVMLGTGGLSHQLDGKRAGFINKPFDLMCMEKIVSDPEALARLSTLDLVRAGRGQGRSSSCG